MRDVGLGAKKLLLFGDLLYGAILEAQRQTADPEGGGRGAGEVDKKNALYCCERAVAIFEISHVLDARHTRLERREDDIAGNEQLLVQRDSDRDANGAGGEGSRYDAQG